MRIRLESRVYHTKYRADRTAERDVSTTARGLRAADAPWRTARSTSPGNGVSGGKVYNFCTVHTTLGQTPAMAMGITDRVWTAYDLTYCIPLPYQFVKR